MLLTNSSTVPSGVDEGVWTSLMGTYETVYNKFGWAKLEVFKNYATGGTMSTNLLGKIEDYLIITPEDFSLIKQIWGIVLPGACALFVLYFLLNFTEEISGHVRELDIKFWTMTFIKFAIAAVFFQYGIKLVVGIIDVGNSMITKAIEGEYTLNASSATGLNQSEYLEALIKTVDKMTFSQALVQCVVGVFYNIISAIPVLLIILQAITRQITIILQGGLTPLSFADIYQHGTRSTAFTYLKKFAVSLLHGLLMVWVIQIVSSLSFSVSLTDAGLIDLNDWLSLLGTGILYNIAAVGLMSAGKQLLNDAFGC